MLALDRGQSLTVDENTTPVKKASPSEECSVEDEPPCSTRTAFSSTVTVSGCARNISKKYTEGL